LAVKAATEVAGDGRFGVGHACTQAGEVRAEDDVGRGCVGLERNALANEGDEFLIVVGGKR
jgi:hypothetical protein